MSFELLGEDGRDQPNRALLDISAGNFQILDVTPGTYKLRASQDASQKQTRGEVMVTVGSSDVSGVSLALLPPVTVSVSTRPVASGPVELATCQITLHPSPLYIALSNGSDHQFSMEMFPGEYQVRFQCYNGHAESASFGSTDLLANPVLTISPGETPPAFAIEVKPGGGTLKVKSAGRAHSILLVPAFAESTGPALKPTGLDFGQPAQDVLFTNLAPGDYSIYGLSQFKDTEFRNPAFLEALSERTTIHIEDGKTAEVTITGISK